MPLSYYDSICYYNTVKNTALPCSELQVRLVPHCLRRFKVLHYYHLLICRANAAWHALEKLRKTKWSRASWKGKFFSSGWVLECFFFNFFFFEKMSPSLLTFLVMLFIYVGKHSNIPSQMFFKTGVLISHFHRKTPVLESLFDKVTGLKTCIFIKKDSNTDVFLWLLQDF